MDRYDLGDAGMVKVIDGTWVWYDDVLDLVTDLVDDMAQGKRKPSEELTKRLEEFYNE